MRTTLLFTLAVGGFTLGVALVQHLSGSVQDATVADRFDYLALHGDSVNVVFIGSSRVGVNLNPTSFDERLREAGYDSESFHFCLGAMYAGEARSIVDNVLSVEPRPRLLVVETLPAHGGIREYDMLTDRNLWWRELRDLPHELGDALSGGGSPLGHHLRLTFVHVLRIGKGVRIISRLLHSTPQREPLPDKGHNAFVKGHWGTFEDGTTVIRAAAYKLTLNVPSEEEARPYRRFHEQILAIVDGRAEVVFILPPGSILAPSNFASDPSVIATNDPVAYPALYDPSRWADPVHLLGGAAQEHGRLFAEALIERTPSTGMLVASN